VQLVAGDSQWAYSDPGHATIAILGAHDVCGYPTGAPAVLVHVGEGHTTITASVDGQQVVLASDSRSATGTPPWESGPAGIEAGAFTSTWPQAQYSTLSITP